MLSVRRGSCGKVVQWWVSAGEPVGDGAVVSVCMGSCWEGGAVGSVCRGARWKGGVVVDVCRRAHWKGSTVVGICRRACPGCLGCRHKNTVTMNRAAWKQQESAAHGSGA